MQDQAANVERHNAMMNSLDSRQHSSQHTYTTAQVSRAAQPLVKQENTVVSSNHLQLPTNQPQGALSTNQHAHGAVPYLSTYNSSSIEPPEPSPHHQVGL